MARSQRSIQAFTRVSKPQTGSASVSKKRKTFVPDSSPEPTVQDVKKRRIQQYTPPDTPTKACKRAFAGLTLSAPQPVLKSAKRKRFAPTPSPRVDTPPTSPLHASQAADESTACKTDFPAELHELIRLNRSFLSALSLHYAHNGTSSPVDIRRLTLSITKLWGKRKVLSDDVRVCLGVLQNAVSPSLVNRTDILSIANYGNGKIFLELKVSRKRAGRVMSQPFNEEQFSRIFSENLENAWVQWTKSQKSAVWDKFYQQLPIAEVVMSAAAYANPALLKGQQRLDQVLKSKNDDEENVASGRNKRRKAGRVVAMVEITNRAPPATIPAKPHAREDTPVRDKENVKPDLNAITANIRGLSLLDRIKAKEVAAANSPAAPTRAERERRAALQRSEEMLGILDMLAIGKGGQRASFPLPALVRSVQSSVRSPMSKEEIERCLDVLEKDIASGFVKVSKFGSVVGVVINRLCKPTAVQVQQRLKASGAV
jgi:DNA replication factor Cdt1 C-terminal domain